MTRRRAKGNDTGDPRALSRREREIMDAVYALGSASASQVRDGLPEAPSYSAVRAHLRILEEKGHLRHESDGPRYIFFPTVPHQQASATALRRVLRTFFDDSTDFGISFGSGVS